MMLVLDSCIVSGDYRMTSADFQVLEDSGRSVGVRLHLPEVVVRECVRNFKRKAVALHEKALELSRLLAQEPAEKDLESEAQRYYGYQRFGAKILDLPKVSVADTIDTILEEYPPFTGGSDRHYRDFIVWKTVVAFERTLHKKTPIAFVSSDKGFWTENTFKPELTIDLQHKERFQAFKSLAAFNEAFITPRLKSLKSVKEQIASGVHPLITIPLLERTIGIALLSRAHDVAPMIIRLVRGWDRGLLGMPDLKGFSLTDVKRLPSGRLIVSISGVAVALAWRGRPNEASHDSVVKRDINVDAQFIVSPEEDKPAIASLRLHAETGAQAEIRLQGVRFNPTTIESLRFKRGTAQPLVPDF